MAIKYFCDCCLKEAKDQNFVCEITIAEMRDTYDLTKANNNITPQRQMRKLQLQVCKECFNEHFSKLLKYDK